MILKNDFDCTNAEDIKTMYRQAYYPVAVQLHEKGLSEVDIKVKFRKALMYFCHQYKQNTFDLKNLDIVLYLLTLCLLESAPPLAGE